MPTDLKFSPKELEILVLVRRNACSRKMDLYLVGGILRDILIGRRKKALDIDFALKDNAINFGRKLARSMKAGFVLLDRRRGACRVVKKTTGGLLTLDFTDFRGRTLKEDLLHRDFSINSLALSLEAAVSGPGHQDQLIDPYAGMRDLRRGLIRAVNKAAFSEDPVRILRMYGFSAALGFAIDRQTLIAARKQKKLLGSCSGERLRDELFKILDTTESAGHLKAMHKTGILQVVFPEIKRMRGIGRGGYHHLDVLDHTLETIKQLDGLCGKLRGRQRLREYLDEELSVGRRREALLKLGALLHDIGKPQAMRRHGRVIKFHGHERIGLGISEVIAKRLKLSNEEAQALRKMVLWHLRPGYLAGINKITAHARYRFFRDTGPEALSVLILSLADQQATCGPKVTAAFKRKYEATVYGLIEDYFAAKESQAAPRLVNGDELMAKFHLKPSPLIGKILSRIDELQALGSIKSKKEALERARKLIRTTKDVRHSTLADARQRFVAGGRRKTNI